MRRSLPAVRRCVGVPCALLLLSTVPVACGETSPAGPGRVTPPGAAGTVNGTVLDFSTDGSSRPVPNLHLTVWHSPQDGRVGATRVADVRTDAQGGYALSGLTGRLFFVETAPGEPYRFLCPAYPLYLSGQPVNLPVVAVEWAGGALPRGLAIPHTSVLGTVIDALDGRPVAGATVTLDNAVQDVAATTNASGFYMVCSAVGTDQVRTIVARKESYVPITREIFGGWDPFVNFTLTPQ